MDTIYIILRSGKDRERAEADEYMCGYADCPLRKQNRCIQLQGFISPRCPYGKIRGHDGPTKRSRDHLGWVKGWKKEAEKYGDWTGWNKVAYIGDYVYLPYPHMDSDRLPYGQVPLPFQDYSNFMHSSDKPFIPRNSFNAEMVVRAAKLRPQAMVGGTITKYVYEIVPQFLLDLLELDPGLFDEAVSLEPSLLERINKYLPIDIPAAWLNQVGFVGKVYLDNSPVTLLRGWLEWEWEDEDGWQNKKRQPITNQVVKFAADHHRRIEFESRYKQFTKANA